MHCAVSQSDSYSTSGSLRWHLCDISESRRALIVTPQTLDARYCQLTSHCSRAEQKSETVEQRINSYKYLSYLQDSVLDSLHTMTPFRRGELAGKNINNIQKVGKKLKGWIFSLSREQKISFCDILHLTMHLCWARSLFLSNHLLHIHWITSTRSRPEVGNSGHVISCFCDTWQLQWSSETWIRMLLNSTLTRVAESRTEGHSIFPLTVLWASAEFCFMCLFPGKRRATQEVSVQVFRTLAGKTTHQETRTIHKFTATLKKQSNQQSWPWININGCKSGQRRI